MPCGDGHAFRREAVFRFPKAVFLTCGESRHDNNREIRDYIESEPGQPGQKSSFQLHQRHHRARGVDAERKAGGCDESRNRLRRGNQDPGGSRRRLRDRLLPDLVHHRRIRRLPGLQHFILC